MISGVNWRWRMRALIVALAIAGAAGAASACANGYVSSGQGEVQVPLPTPIVPSGARQQAEDAIKHDLGDLDSVTFRAVRTMEAATVRHGAFAQPIDGPVAVVCGQFDSRDRTGGHSGYPWFFVAIKEGQVLWTAFDKSAGEPGEAYYSCDKAGLTPASARWNQAEFHDR
jgi:hypothetical protein